MRSMLLTRYPLLARSPSTLHDMAVRLFVNSVANNVAAQNGLADAQTGVPPTSSSATASTNVAPGFSHSSPTAGSSSDTLPLVVDVDNESSNDDN